MKTNIQDILKKTYTFGEAWLRTHPDTPVLFLDIDGVLNSEQFYRRREKGVHIDREAVARLNSLGDVAVVISSSWGYNDDTMNTLIGAGLKLPVIAGVTPFYASFGERGRYIDEWVKTFLNNGRRYAIVDDDNDMLESQYDVFVQTSPYVGLTDTDVESLRKILF